MSVGLFDLGIADPYIHIKGIIFYVCLLHLDLTCYLEPKIYINGSVTNYENDIIDSRQSSTLFLVTASQ